MPLRGKSRLSRKVTEQTGGVTVGGNIPVQRKALSASTGRLMPTAQNRGGTGLDLFHLRPWQPRFFQIFLHKKNCTFKTLANTLSHTLH